MKPFTDGLLLEGGRKINWHVAALKLMADELEINADLAERLRKALAEKGVGDEFISALSTKFSVTDAIPF